MIAMTPYTSETAKIPSGDYPYWKQHVHEAQWNPTDAWERIKAANREEHDG